MLPISYSLVIFPEDPSRAEEKKDIHFDSKISRKILLERKSNQVNLDKSIFTCQSRKDFYMRVSFFIESFIMRNFSF